MRSWISCGRVFQPAQLVRRPHLDLLDGLRRHGVSQRHTVDSGVWRTIAEALVRLDLAPVVHRAVSDGVGDVRELRQRLDVRRPGGTDLFPIRALCAGCRFDELHARRQTP